MAAKTPKSLQHSEELSADLSKNRLWFQKKEAGRYPTFVITLWPYRSLSQKGFKILMICLGSLMSLIALVFFLLGAWPVIGFLGAEIVIVWLAFKINYRAGQIIERVEISAQRVQVTRINWRGNQTHLCLESPWVRAELQQTPDQRPKLYLRAHAKKMEIGAFMPPVEKSGLAKALNQTLAQARYQTEATA